jgi:putative aldouronate transport system substrate-binding protein
MWPSGSNKNAIAFLARKYLPFIHGAYFGLALYDGKVTEQYRLPEFRQALQFIAGLYKEGLIAKDSFILTTDEAKALANAEPPIVGAYAHGQMNGLMTTNAPNWIDTFIMPPLKGENGQIWASNYEPWNNLGNLMSITDKAKNPEIAIALYDYLGSNFETQQTGYLGDKGVTWVDPDPGALGLNGKPAVWKQLADRQASPLNSSWLDIYPVWIFDYRYGMQADGIDNIKKWIDTWDPALKNEMVGNGAYNEGHNYIFSDAMTPYAIPEKYFIPPLALNDADDTRLADIGANLNTFVDTAIMEFVTGIRNINNDAAWNTYLAELDQGGSKERAAIIQKYIK